MVMFPSFFLSLPEGKPPFPMVFPRFSYDSEGLKPPTSNGFGNDPKIPRFIITFPIFTWP